MALILVRGAEADVSDGTWMDRPAIVKARIPKAYRHPDLDAAIRADRTRDEAHLLVAARQAGVPVPVVYDIDRQGATITMERITGQPLRHVLEAEGLQASRARFTLLGRIIARLHAAGLTHGDLTTSNILVPDGRDGIVLIDFGLGQATEEDEPRAVDLHLMEEALEATHPEATALMEDFVSSYMEHFGRATHVLKRLDDVRERGRYRVAG